MPKKPEKSEKKTFLKRIKDSYKRIDKKGEAKKNGGKTKKTGKELLDPAECDKIGIKMEMRNKNFAYIGGFLFCLCLGMLIYFSQVGYILSDNGVIDWCLGIFIIFPVTFWIFAIGQTLVCYKEAG